MGARDVQELVYDPSDAGVMADPFALYERLRDEEPVHWSPSLKSWVVTRYDDVRDLLLSDRLSVRRLVQFYAALPPADAALLEDIVRYLNLWIAFRDPPDHTRVRRIMRHAFTASAIDAMRPGIREIAQLLLDRLKGRRDVDLIREYASPLPAFVIMDLLGVPRGRLDDFKEWSDDMAVFIGGARNADDKYERAARGCREMSAYFRELVEKRTRDPQPGFLMDLIGVHRSWPHPSRVRPPLMSSRGVLPCQTSVRSRRDDELTGPAPLPNGVADGQRGSQNGKRAFAGPGSGRPPPGLSARPLRARVRPARGPSVPHL